jgi:ATP adenylyltransferase
MDSLYAPWRMQYILSNAEKDGEKKGCFFCEYAASDEDEKHLILARGKHCFVIMNAFPYNPGHLMAVPYRHTADFRNLTAGERDELMTLSQTANEVLSKVMKPQGFNLGMNLGRIAGAGVDDHLHMHIVPRWSGDTNFIPVLAEVRVLSQALAETWKSLKDAWPK